ncbi:MAG: 4Fe-4S dicluster domain-containing protein [Desulfocapsa sp.]|nr:4Fe-4S dicluster domain-containing protein [Desulfocapsa sp.]
MDKQRRKFLKIAGASVVAGIGAPVLVKLSSSPALASSDGGHAPVAAGHAPMPDAHGGGHVEEAPEGVRLGMVIDMRKIADTPALLDKAISACVNAHNVPQFPDKKNEIKWIWKAPFENVFTDKSASHTSKRVADTQFVALCNHCDDPPCVRACPTQATFKLAKNGIVAMDFHRCIGCRFCMAACPYGARSFNWQDPRPYIKKYNKEFPSRMRGVVEKCNFCGERLALGQEPACVEACKGTGAILFGDLNDAGSEVRAVLDKEFTIQRKPTLGTKPSVFYIV